MSLHDAIEHSARSSRMVGCGYEYNRSKIMLITPRGEHLAYAPGSRIRSRNSQDVGHAERSQLAYLSRARIFVRKSAPDEFPIFSAWRIGKNRDLLRDTISNKVSSFERSGTAGIKRHDDNVSRTNWFVDDKRPSHGFQNRHANRGNGCNSSQGQCDYE
jgi:hypothetical protein